MRKVLFFLFSGVLLALVAARCFLPEARTLPAVAAGGLGFNILELNIPLAPETAGSAVISDLNTHFLFRTPTAKNEYSGLLEGYNLILICADSWHPDLSDHAACPALYTMHREGIRFTDVYRPDWYQEMDGREFSLLTGIIPTNVNGETALLHTGSSDIYFPWSLGTAFSAAGYETLVSFREAEHLDAYLALGFPRRIPGDRDPRKTLSDTLPLLVDLTPFFAFYIWDTDEGSEALSFLLEFFSTSGLEENTVLCLLTGNGEEHRAQIFLHSEGLPAGEVSLPCSELDIAPTLLNLFGIPYDSRFLAGHDLFSYDGSHGYASATTPIVSLYGSARSDWVTPAGSYIASESLFWQRLDCFASPQALSDYVHDISALVYDRYAYARKIMETDYFRVILSP